MEYNKLIIQVKFTFKNLPYVVFDVNGKLYNIGHCPGKRTIPDREIKPYLNNNCIGYRINSKYYSKKKLNELAIKSDKIITLYVVQHTVKLSG